MTEIKSDYDVKADELPTFKCLPMVNFIGVCLLTIAMIMLWSTSYESGVFSAAHTRQLENPSSDGLILKKGDRKDAHSFESHGAYPFNIYRPENSHKRNPKEGFLMRLPVRGYLPLDFERLGHYSVCCYTSDRLYFVCHSVTQNIGVECVIQKERSNNKPYASIVVQHSDMVGAMCVLNWEYKI